jgi:hypothetical protein
MEEFLKEHDPAPPGAMWSSEEIGERLRPLQCEPDITRLVGRFEKED